MNSGQINKDISNKVIPSAFSRSSRKEVKMSTKSVLRIVISASLLVAILLAVQVMVSKSEANTTSAIHPANYYVGSDWIERHPSVIHPANYYAGSDWIERHPTIIRPSNYYALSDYYERHPRDPYAGSDYIERHPIQPDK